MIRDVPLTEIAFWRAKTEIENERYTHAREEAEANAERNAKNRAGLAKIGRA